MHEGNIFSIVNCVGVGFTRLYGVLFDSSDNDVQCLLDVLHILHEFHIVDFLDVTVIDVILSQHVKQPLIHVQPKTVGNS